MIEIKHKNTNVTRIKLNRANLSNIDLSNIDLSNIDLSNVDLSNADLGNADLSNADLSNADINGANLNGACLSDAKLPLLDTTPVIGSIHQKVYEAAKNNLSMKTWHSECGTSHCWAGWVVTLAGDAGIALEDAVGTNAAAALILMRSDPKLKQIPNWIDNDNVALSKMKLLADLGNTDLSNAQKRRSNSPAINVTAGDAGVGGL